MLSRVTCRLARQSARLFCAQNRQTVAAVPGVEPASALDFISKQWPALSTRLLELQCHEVMMQICFFGAFKALFETCAQT